MILSVRRFTGLLAVIAALALPAMAQAQVVAGSFTAFQLTHAEFRDFDIDGDGTNDFRYDDHNGICTLLPLVANNSIFANVSGNILAIPQGGTIAASQPFTGTGNFNLLTGGDYCYVGVTFYSSGSPHSAWLFFGFGGDNNTLYEGAWESTSGATILAGARPPPMPEPAHVAVGLGLVAALAVWVRRRKPQA